MLAPELEADRSLNSECSRDQRPSSAFSESNAIAYVHSSATRSRPAYRSGRRTSVSPARKRKHSSFNV